MAGEIKTATGPKYIDAKLALKVEKGFKDDEPRRTKKPRPTESKTKKKTARK